MRLEGSGFEGLGFRVEGLGSQDAQYNIYIYIYICMYVCMLGCYHACNVGA